jgi:WD40 repeat protein/transcriptional regulator with XRE-family HTH domain
MRSSYRERDFVFGQTMLTLRSAIGLTQVQLANHLGISRRAVGEWEAGSSYPKAEHLKEVIALGVKQQAFPAGYETEEIRLLWKAAHQKELLDEHWLCALLGQRPSPRFYVVPPYGTGQAQGTGSVQGTGSAQGTILTGSVEEVVTGTSVESLPASGPRVDWGDALAVSPFYGREQELTQLTQWVVQERCRVVSVLGMGGIGKSAVSVSLMHSLAEHFEVVIFRLLRDAPSCEVLLDEYLQVLSPQSLAQAQEGGNVGTAPIAYDARVGARHDPYRQTSLEQRINLLLSHLRKTRVLLVVDNLESLVQEGDVKGRFRPGFEGYGQLLRRVAETTHQSCLLLTSREELTELRPLGSKHSPVRSLRLSGLDNVACRRILGEKDVAGSQREQERLIEVYAGNPLALKIVAETIVDLFGGEIGPFLSGEALIFGSIAELLGEQFARLSALEKSLLCWLAIMREPMTLDELFALLVSPQTRIQMLEALDGLYRRSLIERGKRTGSFTLQSVVLEYVTAFLIAEGSREIQQRRLDQLIQYGLSHAHAKEYVRQTQERLLLSPLLANLQGAYLGRIDGKAGTGSVSRTIPTTSTFGPVEEVSLSLLEELRELSAPAQGYGPANLIALLRLLRGNLNGLDLSHLSIRGAYLQNVEMCNTSLSGAQIRDSVWTSAVSATWTVAISSDGQWWASGSLQGQVSVWKGVRSQTLHLSWQAHTDTISALAFSPDGRTLASGSTDDAIKLWDLEACRDSALCLSGASPRDALLWTGWHNGPQTLAFSPDGSLLASGGMEATVRLWDPQSGMNVQTLVHPNHVFAVAFSPDGKLLASGGVDGEIRLWERREGSPAIGAPIRSVQTGGVTSLAFAPDGGTLASTSIRDKTVKLWEVGSLRLLHTLSEHANQSRCVAWSPDGRILAYSSSDKAIWLWDVEQGSYRAVLHGHTADVCGMRFTLDDTSLLSGSADGTFRVWNVESSQCVHVMQGYGVSLRDLDWSPDGTRLISGGTDGLVTIWDLSDGMTPRNLHGHTWIVPGVGWSPDGRFVASCGLDTVLFLWDPITHTSVQRFEDPSIVFQCMAWSPDGSLLACGTYQQGVQVWDVATRRLRRFEQPYLAWFLSVAWSPDGTRLVGAAHDGSVYLWEGIGDTGQAQGTVPTRLQGHQGRVMSLAWSPDGTLLASGGSSGSGGEVFLWDVQTCRDSDDYEGSSLQSLPVRTFAKHPGRVYALAWSPRGDQLISGGSDGRLRWWDVQSGECVCIQDAYHGMIRSLKVSPDGKFLASCGEDGAIRIWDLCSSEQAVGTRSAQGTIPTAPPLLRTLRHDRPYERMNITGIRGLTEVQKASLQALGAIDEAVP